MYEEITFPCGCRTLIERDDIEFSYCDEHSIQNCKRRIVELENKLVDAEKKLEEAERGKKTIRNEADFEYFKLLDKYQALERKVKTHKDQEDKMIQYRDQRNEISEKLRKMTVEFVKLKRQNSAPKKAAKKKKP